ncbi:MAG TPA: phosphotransferase [Anaerolineaceae bacterium]|nr:phosphotransferase [Anaerolineaceae bacterium]
MLEKPDLPEERISACLMEQYDLKAVDLAFLPLGADVNTAVYRALDAGGRAWFVKLRRGNFAEISVTLPRWLCDQGIRQIIPPLPTRSGRLWVEMGAYRVILYPFLEGQDGYAAACTEAQWAELGRALRCIHTAAVPPELWASIPRETYDPRWRAAVNGFLARADEAFAEPVAAECAALLREQREMILNLVERADCLAQRLQAQPLPEVVCHSDIHAGNILMTAEGSLFIVDWDNPIRAPKERDLMYVGGAQGFKDMTPQMEEMLFYRGYGPTPVNPAALAYYRYERIVEDIAAFCEQLLLSNDGGADRPLGLHYLKSNFQPGNTIEAAYQADIFVYRGLF